VQGALTIAREEFHRYKYVGLATLENTTAKYFFARRIQSAFLVESGRLLVSAMGARPTAV